MNIGENKRQTSWRMHKKVTVVVQTREETTRPRKIFELISSEKIEIKTSGRPEGQTCGEGVTVRDVQENVIIYIYIYIYIYNYIYTLYINIYTHIIYSI